MNVLGTPGDQDFVSGLNLALSLARHWDLIHLPVDSAARVHVVNWRFEGNEPTGDAGVAYVETDSATGGGISLDGCTFRSCDVGVVDTLIAIVNDALGATE